MSIANQLDKLHPKDQTHKVTLHHRVGVNTQTIVHFGFANKDAAAACWAAGRKAMVEFHSKHKAERYRTFMGVLTDALGEGWYVTYEDIGACHVVALYPLNEDGRAGDNPYIWIDDELNDRIQVGVYGKAEEGGVSQNEEMFYLSDPGQRIGDDPNRDRVWAESLNDILRILIEDFGGWAYKADINLDRKDEDEQPAPRPVHVTTREILTYDGTLEADGTLAVDFNGGAEVDGIDILSVNDAETSEELDYEDLEADR